MNRVRALQIIALNEVLSENQSEAFQLRSIHRWYSKTFHTPLHIVEELPELDILQAYFEDHYEELNNSNEGQSHIQKLLEDLCKTEEELLLDQKRKDEDEVWAYKEEKAIEGQNKGNSRLKLDENKRKAKEKLDRDKRLARQIEALQNKDAVGARLEPEKANNSATLDIPNFEMNFDNIDLGGLENIDSLTGVK